VNNKSKGMVTKLTFVIIVNGFQVVALCVWY